MVVDADGTGNYELFTMTVTGETPVQLTSDTRFDSWWPRLSPDRSRILFYRTPKGVHDTAYEQASLWTINADGTGIRQLRARGLDGWTFQGHAEWSPSGLEIVMIGSAVGSLQIFITDAWGNSARQITSRPGLNLDPSWSPDGRTIVFVGCASATCGENDFEIYSIAASGGVATRLTNNQLRDHDPYFSPDGRTIAWLERTDPAGLGVWNIRIMNADGSGQRPVTNDGQINSKPNWSTNGSLIYFHRFAYAVGKWDIYSIRPDGTGMTRITSAGGNVEFPSP